MVPAGRRGTHPSGHESDLMIFMNRRRQPVRYHRPVYEDPPPFRSLALEVSQGHRLQVQLSGKPAGIPALVLHGGPGSGCSPLLRRFFDPARYCIVCVDQRGAGRSTPRGATAHNTTADLLDDLRALRELLGIGRWLVVGGSWGATLALAYALREPAAVLGLLLRATFLARASDIEAFFARPDGQPPLRWQEIDRATSSEAGAIALAWWRHEQSMSGSPAPAPAPPAGAALEALVDRYRVQSHYLRHRCWLDEPPLLDRCAALPRVPTLLLHGSADRVCPPAGAAALHARVPHAGLRWVEGAGHDPAHPAMAAAMVEALDRFACAGSLEQEAHA